MLLAAIIFHSAVMPKTTDSLLEDCHHIIAPQWGSNSACCNDCSLGLCKSHNASRFADSYHIFYRQNTGTQFMQEKVTNLGLALW